MDRMGPLKTYKLGPLATGGRAFLEKGGGRLVNLKQMTKESFSFSINRVILNYSVENSTFIAKWDTRCGRRRIV